jgi:hypothetical protein
METKELTFAQKVILEMAEKKAKGVQFQDHLEDDDYTDYYDDSDYNDDSQTF